MGYVARATCWFLSVWAVTACVRRRLMDDLDWQQYFAAARWGSCRVDILCRVAEHLCLVPGVLLLLCRLACGIVQT